MPRTVNLSLLVLTLCLSVSTSGVVGQRSDSTTADFARELVRSDSSAKRSQLLAVKKELVTTELARELVKQGNFLLLDGKYSTAFDVYTLAGSVSSQLKDIEGLASASLNLGTVYYFQGNYAPALEHYREARTLFTSTRNQAEAAKAISGVALILKEQKKDAEALEVFAQALQEFESLDDRAEMANTLSSMGAIYYARGQYAEASKAFLRSKELNGGSDNELHTADALYMQGDYTRASDYYRSSLNSFEHEGNQAGLISALVGVANSNYYQGKYDEALEYYLRSATIQEQQRDESGVATSLQGVGNVYRALGDLGSAMENYLKSLAVAEHSAVKISTATTLGSIGLVRAMLGDHAQAMDYFKQSLAQFEATGDKVGMARMLGHLGNTFYAGENYEPALASYRKSLSLRESMNDTAGQAGLLVGIANVFMAQSNYPEALENYQKALRLYQGVNNKDAAAYVLTRLAEANLFQANYSETLTLAERAFALAKEVESFSTSWYARMVYGKAQRKLDQPTQATQAFGEAITLIESLRSHPAAAELGDSRSGVLPYLAQVDLLIDQNKPVEAFDFAERAKVEALGDLFRRTSRKITKEMSADEEAQERKLIGETVSINLQLGRQIQSRNYDEVRGAALRNQLRQLRTSYGEFRRRLFANHPSLRVARAELPSLRLEETRALVGDKQTALLEFVITEDRPYLFVLTLDVVAANAPAPNRAGGISRSSSVGPQIGSMPGSKPGSRPRPAPAGPIVNLKVYPLNLSNRDLADRVGQFQRLLVNRDEAFRPVARELYDLLLKPADEQLTDKTKLIIVPDGVLWRMPFAALQPVDDRYLVERASISYAPSLSALREMRKPRHPQNTRKGNSKTLTSALTLTVFGKPVLTPNVVRRLQPDAAADKNENNTSMQAQAAQAPELSRERALEQASEDRDIQKPLAVYGNAQSRVFAGESASEARARIETGRPNVILHFGGPSLLDDAMPMYSFIALSALPGRQQAENGLLQPWEIMNLNSEARLVVLAGAEMGGGRVGPGDSLASLSWAWFVAGTPSLALTRWPVRSPALTQFMSDFHAGVKSGATAGSSTKLQARLNQQRSTSKAEALRQSMLTLIRSADYQHPYYWSAFMLIGDAR